MEFIPRRHSSQNGRINQIADLDTEIDRHPQQVTKTNGTRLGQRLLPYRKQANIEITALCGDSSPDHHICIHQQCLLERNLRCRSETPCQRPFT